MSSGPSVDERAAPGEAAVADGRPPALELLGITKAFGGRAALERDEPRRLDPPFALLVERDECPCAFPAHGAGDLADECSAFGLTAECRIATQLSGRAKHSEVASAETSIEVEATEEQDDSNDSGPVGPPSQADSPRECAAK